MLGALVFFVLSQFLTTAPVVATVMSDTATIRTLTGEPGDRTRSRRFQSPER